MLRFVWKDGALAAQRPLTRNPGDGAGAIRRPCCVSQTRAYRRAQTGSRASTSIERSARNGNPNYSASPSTSATTGTRRQATATCATPPTKRWKSLGKDEGGRMKDEGKAFKP